MYYTSTSRVLHFHFPSLLESSRPQNVRFLKPPRTITCRRTAKNYVTLFMVCLRDDDGDVVGGIDELGGIEGVGGGGR